MKYILLLIIILSFTSCRYNLKAEIGKSYDLIENMQFNKAYNKLNKVLQIDSINSEALNYKGLAALYLGKLDEAHTLLRKAYFIDSLTAINNQNLGLYYSYVNKFDSARIFYNKALTLDTLNPKVLSNLAVVATNEGKFIEAFRIHEEAISIAPNLGGLYVNRGETFLAIGDTSKAFSDYELTLNLQINKMSKLYTLRRRGFLYREIKNYEKAIEDFSRAIEITNTDMYLFYYRGLSHAGLYNYELALKDFKKAKKLGKNETDSIIEECEELLKNH